MISNKLSPVNEFSPELWDQLSKTLHRAVEPTSRMGPVKRIAAFDADGTLWDSDAGETFFDWEIHHAGLRDLPEDPWAHYHALKKLNPITAYVWLAQINAGVPLWKVREWARQCFAEHPAWPVFESQRRLVDLLRSLDFEIFIITASIKWAVEPVAALVGIDHDHVIGITTKINEVDCVGMEAVLPITWRQGKADGLLGATKGIRPIIASGNTLGDIALLETASHIQLAISTQNTPGGLFDEEAKLGDEADRRGWLRHRFRP
jgi:phosphoserine phosphatase